MAKRIVDLNNWVDYEVIGKAEEFEKRVEVENKEFNLIWQESETTFNGSFIFLANSEELERWEDLLLLSHEGTIEERRHKVYVKWNKQVKWTHRTLEDYLNDYLGIGNYEFEIHYNEYEFLITVEYKDVRVDSVKLRHQLRRIIPANLVIITQFRFIHNLYFGMYGKQARHSTMLPADFITDYNNDMYFAYYPIVTRLIKTKAINPPIENIAGIETLNYGMHAIRKIKYITTQVKE